MSEGAVPEAGPKLPFEAALLEVVKSLHKDPVLVYGIGAGIILVAALSLTASLGLVLVVAAVLVVVVLGRIVGGAQAKRGGGVFTRVFDIGGHYEDSRVGSVDAPAPPPGPVRTGFFGIGTRAKGSQIGNVNYGAREDAEDG